MDILLLHPKFQEGALELFCPLQGGDDDLHGVGFHPFRQGNYG